MKAMFAALLVATSLAAPLQAQVNPGAAFPVPTPRAALAEPNATPLYPNGAPAIPGAAAEERWDSMMGEPLVRNVVKPTIAPFLPAPGKATGAAVIVAPGGAFVMLAIDNEGWAVAKWLADHGIAAFVLKYRVQPTPADEAAFDKAAKDIIGRAATADAASQAPPSFPPAIDDGIAAMRFVRGNAARWGIDPHRVGMIGFSAGAMTALSVTLANAPGAMPDFTGLIYGPMSPVTPPPGAPPLFAALAGDDPLFGRSGFGIVDSWRKAGRPVELHVYQQGGHGFGMHANGTSTMLWPDEFVAWLNTNHLLQPAAR